MATTFVFSGATGANNGTSWTDAWTSAASSSGVAAGDTVKVHKTHSETTLAANINWSNGTAANPVMVVCVDKDAADALATGAIIGWNTTNTGPQGNVYFYGCTLQNSAVNFRLTCPTGGTQQYEQCTFKSTSSGGVAIGGGSESKQYIKWTNCNLDYSGASASTVSLILTNLLRGTLEWQGGTFTMRGTQISAIAIADGSNMKIRGVNFSGTVTNILSSATTSSGNISFENCIAPTYTNVFSTAPTSQQCRVKLDGFLAGTLTTALLPPTLVSDVYGTIASDKTHYRTGGSDDGSQANEYSWAVTSTSIANPIFAELECPQLTRWVGTGSQTITIYVASGVTLNNDEFWIEVLSPSEAVSATAQAKFQSTRKAMLATAAALTTDGTSTWNGSGVGTKQKCSVTINPTVPGPVIVRCHLAKGSTTVYVDPIIDLAGDVNGNSRMMEGVQQFASAGGTSGGGANLLGNGTLVVG